jgi:hypothetical protein
VGNNRLRLLDRKMIMSKKIGIALLLGVPALPDMSHHNISVGYVMPEWARQRVQ